MMSKSSMFQSKNRIKRANHTLNAREYIQHHRVIARSAFNYDKQTRAQTIAKHVKRQLALLEEFE